jgi:hypothetical protein
MKTTAGSCAWSFVPSLIEPMLKTGANQADLDGGTLQKDIGVAQHNMATGRSRMYPIHMGVGNPTYHLERKQQVATTYKERRRIEHIGWLRSAVLGAKDGITSNGSLILGAAAAHATHANILLSGIAVLVGGGDDDGYPQVCVSILRVRYRKGRFGQGTCEARIGFRERVLGTKRYICRPRAGPPAR